MDNKVESSQEQTEYGAPPRKGGVFNTLYPPGPQPGAKGRMKNHCRRFWWCGKSSAPTPEWIYVLILLRLSCVNRSRLGHRTAHNLCRHSQHCTTRNQRVNPGGAIGRSYQPIA